MLKIKMKNKEKWGEMFHEVVDVKEASSSSDPKVNKAYVFANGQTVLNTEVEETDSNDRPFDPQNSGQ